MFGEILIALLLGVASGVLTGLIPGLHINMVGAILATVSALLLNYFQPITLAVFLFATALTHTFVDAIPATLLGAPSPDTVEMILPAHKLYLQGKGYEAVRLATQGAHIGMMIGTLCIPIFILIIPYIYEPLSPYIGWLLLIISIYFIITEQDMNKRFWALVIFTFSGVLGSMVLTFPNLEQPLLPMLSGLFGISTLLISTLENPVRVIQKRTQESTLNIKHYAQTMITAISAGWIASLLPGLGTAQATMAARATLPKHNPRAFMVAAGAINTLNYLFSLATWLVLEKARNGAVVVIKQLVQVSNQAIVLLSITGVIVAGLATITTIFLARASIKIINKIHYNTLAISIMVFLTALTTIVSGFYGLLIMVISTAVGVLTQLVGVRKSAAMGCLVIPVIVFFLG